jgi:uracil-DNA glycosylase
LFGSQFRLTQHRGELIESELAAVAAATIHPAAIVRERDAESREHERAALADDLRGVLAAVAQSS